MDNRTEKNVHIEQSSFPKIIHTVGNGGIFDENKK